MYSPPPNHVFLQKRVDNSQKQVYNEKQLKKPSKGKNVMKDLRMNLNAYFYFGQGYYYGAGYFACMKLSSPESRFAVS